ncbi:MAG: hypothetical protein SFX18_05850 [Pirellulales bacterium]|nr:hypothetical protein [Pirellulales bacterium]
MPVEQAFEQAAKRLESCSQALALEVKRVLIEVRGYLSGSQSVSDAPSKEAVVELALRNAGEKIDEMVVAYNETRKSLGF